MSLLLTLSAAATAHAQTLLPVLDSSFETPVVGDGSEGLLEGTNHITGVPYTESSFFQVGVADPNVDEFGGSDFTDTALPGAASEQAMSTVAAKPLFPSLILSPHYWQ